jgi:hypothetical protein
MESAPFGKRGPRIFPRRSSSDKPIEFIRTARPAFRAPSSGPTDAMLLPGRLVEGRSETTGVTHKSGSGVESALISPREKILARSKWLSG